jgi:hypothetical protein
LRLRYADQFRRETAPGKLPERDSLLVRNEDKLRRSR